MVGIPEWISQLMLAAIGVVAWWGIRRLVTGQDSINTTLHEISGKMSHLDGRVVKVETRLDMHEASDDDRIEHLEKATDAIWLELRSK